MCAIPERIRGVITTRSYTNLRSCYLTRCCLLDGRGSIAVIHAVKLVFNCALSSGDVYSWTQDDLTQLLQHAGNVDPDNYPALCPVHCLSHNDVVKISASGNLAAAVTRTGQVFTW